MDDLTDNQREVLTALYELGRGTARDVSQFAGIRLSRMGGLLAELSRRELIVRVSPESMMWKPSIPASELFEEKDEVRTDAIAVLSADVDSLFEAMTIAAGEIAKLKESDAILTRIVSNMNERWADQYDDLKRGAADARETKRLMERVEAMIAEFS